MNMYVLDEEFRWMQILQEASVGQNQGPSRGGVGVLIMEVLALPETTQVTERFVVS